MGPILRPEHLEWYRLYLTTYMSPNSPYEKITAGNGRILKAYIMKLILAQNMNTLKKWSKTKLGRPQ